jgi:hypothetical protein
MAAEVAVACARLDAAETDEVRARVKLILRTASEPPRSLLLACDAERAWVVWNVPPAELLDAPQGVSLVESMLDAIERRARRVEPPVGPPPPRAPKPRRIPVSPHETPTWEAPVTPPASPRPLVESGGMGVGLAGELLGGRLPYALGPRLDIGVGWGAWSLQLTESARFARTKSDDSALLYDLGAGFGWGAPFSRRHLLGASLASGGEWFNVEGHTVTTGFSALGARAALPVGAFSISLGLEGRLRWSPQHVGETVDVRVPRWSGLLVLEGVLLVEPPARNGLLPR